MAQITLWAGADGTTPAQWTDDNKLPSAVSVDMTLEEIWNADAGRNAKGNMIATYVAQKYTYAIKWGILSSSEFTKIRNLLTNGFFRFAYNTTGQAPASASLFYRSEITYSLLQVGAAVYYKDVSVSVIQK